MHFIIGNRINYDNFNISSSDRIDFLYTLYLELGYIMFMFRNGKRVYRKKISTLDGRNPTEREG